VQDLKTNLSNRRAFVRKYVTLGAAVAATLATRNVYAQAIAGLPAVLPLAPRDQNVLYSAAVGDMDVATLQQQLGEPTRADPPTASSTLSDGSKIVLIPLTSLVTGQTRAFVHFGFTPAGVPIRIMTTNDGAIAVSSKGVIQVPSAQFNSDYPRLMFAALFPAQYSVYVGQKLGDRTLAKTAPMSIGYLKPFNSPPSGGGGLLPGPPIWGYVPYPPKPAYEGMCVATPDDTSNPIQVQEYKCRSDHDKCLIAAAIAAVGAIGLMAACLAAIAACPETILTCAAVPGICYGAGAAAVAVAASFAACEYLYNDCLNFWCGKNFPDNPPATQN